MMERDDPLGNVTSDKWASLVVASVMAPDNSAFALGKLTMGTLKLSYGDSVLVQGNGHTTLLNVCVAAVEMGRVSLSKDTRQSLQVDTDDNIFIQRYNNPPEVSLSPRKCDDYHMPSLTVSQIERIALSPFHDTSRGFEGSIFCDVLKPYYVLDSLPSFALNGRPVHKGDIFTAIAVKQRHKIQFEVIGMDMNCGIVVPSTTIHCEEAPVQRIDKPNISRYDVPTIPVPLSTYNAMQGLLSTLGNCADHGGILDK